MSHAPESLLQAGADLLSTLSAANRTFMARFPGDSPKRQPVHTVYGGAHLFKAGTTAKLGQIAQRSLSRFAPEPWTLGRVLNLPGSAQLSELSPHDLLAHREAFHANPEALKRSHFAAWLPQAVYQRVSAKLEREAVEDLRIDFEDGFGNRPDTEEDAAAVQAAQEVAKGMAQGSLPPFLGIRIKPLNEETRTRSIQTLELFLTTLVKASGGALPRPFLITLPKVQIPEQVATLVGLLDLLEERLGIEQGTLQIELMIEVTQTIFDSQGRSPIPPMLEAAKGRCFSAHFGTYDYTASCAVTAAYQTMDHAACDFAKHMMRNTLGSTGVFLSDGATNVMPVGPHRVPQGQDLTPLQVSENTQAVHHAWRLGYQHIRHSLQGGFYQGWDLHPAQIPIRYAACYAFFLEGFAPAAERLRNFVEKAAQATLVGDVFDDAATGQGLLNYFLRALNCGAVSLEELSQTGLTQEEIRIRSFGRILDARRQRQSGATPT